jgi:hypothetical protein
MKLDKEIQLAVLNLPPDKKDKLLLQLMRKEPLLVKKLTFELLEDGQTTDARVEKIRTDIENRISINQKNMTPGWLLMELRSANPLITEHLKITKDKLGEVTLTIFMLNLAFERQLEMLQKKQERMDTFNPYVVRRLKSTLEKAAKLDEDYHMEFRADLNRLLKHAFSFQYLATQLSSENIPRQFN